MFWLGFGVTIVGALCLALSQSKHAKLILQRELQRPWPIVARGVGIALWLAAAVLGAELYGVGIGIATFFAWACLGSWAVALLATWRRPVAPARRR
ncbi:MAG: DUF3325 family protein [Pseudomonadota bacterium]